MHVDRVARALDAGTVDQQARKRWLIALAAVLTLPWTLTAAAAVCYVNGAASGTNNGVSWTNAYTDLQSAMADVTCDEAWVAQGVY